MAATSSSSSSPVLPYPNLSHLISVKFTSENYLVRKFQLISYLCGQCLFKYVDGSCPPPKPLLSDSTLNPDYSLLLEHDQMVITALISSFSKTLIA